MKRDILIVDDEIEIRELLERHFRFMGYDVVLAANGVEALEILAKRPMRVVVSDIMMPEMDGITLLGRIRSEYPMTRIIMITGYVTMENALACMRKQAETCIFKPIDDLTELDEAVERAFEYLKHWEKKLLELQGMRPAEAGSR